MSLRPKEQNIKCCLISESVARGGGSSKLLDFAHACTVSALSCNYEGQGTMEPHKRGAVLLGCVVAHILSYLPTNILETALIFLCSPSELHEHIME